MPRPTSADAHLRHSLWFRLERALAASNMHITPLQYVQQSIDDLLLLAHANGWRVIMSADFNGGYGSDNGVYKDILPWSKERHLENLPYRHHLLHSATSSLNTKTSIDHVLTTLPGYSYLPFRPSDSDLHIVDTISDHSPLFADFVTPPLHLKPSYLPPKYSHTDLPLSNAILVNEFQNYMQSTDAPSPPSETSSIQAHANYIDALCDFAVLSVEQIKSVKTAKHRVFQGWSPQYMLDCYYLSFLYRLRQLLQKPEHLHSPQYKRVIEIERLSDSLLSKIEYLNRQKESLSRDNLIVDGSPFPIWSHLTHSESLSSINCIIKPLKKRMHYRRRQQGRRLISKYVQQNEDRRVGKQYRQLFKSLFNRHTRPLDEVVLADGSIVSDHRDLLDVLTDHMQSWHNLNAADPAIQWSAVITDPQYLLRESRGGNLTSLQNVPDHLLSAVNESFSMHKNNKSLHLAMAASLDKEITYQDFILEINKRANNKSPGPSGFTINMLKSLPTSVLEVLFPSLLKAW